MNLDSIVYVLMKASVIFLETWMKIKNKNENGTYANGVRSRIRAWAGECVAFGRFQVRNFHGDPIFECKANIHPHICHNIKILCSRGDNFIASIYCKI